MNQEVNPDEYVPGPEDINSGNVNTHGY